jgi:hypothetical protein
MNRFLLNQFTKPYPGRKPTENETNIFFNNYCLY